MCYKTEEDVLSVFGLNIQAYSKYKGISLEQLHELTGLSYTYLSSVQNGKKNISLTNAAKISIALNIPLSILVTDINI